MNKCPWMIKKTIAGLTRVNSILKNRVNGTIPVYFLLLLRRITNIHL